MRGRLLCLHTSNLPCSTMCHLAPRYRVPLCIRYWRALLEDDFPHVFIHPAPTSTPDSACLVSVHTITLTVHPAPATHSATTSLIAAHAAARAVHPAPATHATTAPHGVHLAPSAHTTIAALITAHAAARAVHPAPAAPTASLIAAHTATRAVHPALTAPTASLIAAHTTTHTLHPAPAAHTTIASLIAAHAATRAAHPAPAAPTAPLIAAHAATHTLHPAPAAHTTPQPRLHLITALLLSSLSLLPCCVWLVLFREPSPAPPWPPPLSPPAPRPPLAARTHPACSVGTVLAATILSSLCPCCLWYIPFFATLCAGTCYLRVLRSPVPTCLGTMMDSDTLQSSLHEHPSLCTFHAPMPCPGRHWGSH
jgi:hypothetical protein